MDTLSKWKTYTPEGVQDILIDDCYIKRSLEEQIRYLFRLYGYCEVETPMLEFYDTFAADGELIPQETMFKFFDQQGRILVLRPDITIPIARITATKFKNTQFPIKLSYIGNTFSYNEHGGGKQKEYTQAGVEIIGVKTPEADAEGIVTAINTLKAAGLESFQIDIGEVDFFKGLMEETGLSKQDIEQMRLLIENKDFVGIEELVKGYAIRDDLKELILSLPGLFGSIEILDKVKKITVNKRSLKALENLKKVFEILDDYGVSKNVAVDLGMVQRLNYYTGIIFRGFTYGVGFPVISGGRYDNLIEKFGEKISATGFSIGINLLMMALTRQKIVMDKPKIDYLVTYTQNARKTAYIACELLRKQGLSVEINITHMDIEALWRYAYNKEIDNIIQVQADEKLEVHNIKTNEMYYSSISNLEVGRF